MLLVLLVLTPIFASTKLESTNDGSIYLIKDDNTYKEFVPKSYDKDMGYEVKDTTTINFINQNWDKISLIALGNYLPPASFNKLGSYTNGEYYLLQMNKDITTQDRINFNTYTIPSVKLNDGTTIQGTNERFQSTSSSSALGWHKDRTTTKSITYSVLYNISEGKTPVAVVFTYSDNKTQSCELGSYKAL